MTSSVSSRTPPRARLVPTFCTLLLLAALFSPCTVVAAARDAAPGAALDAAHGASGRRRVLQEPLASDEIASAETAALLAFMRAMGSHPAFSLAGRWSNGPSANRQGQLSQPCADTWQFVTCDSSGRVVTIDMSNPLLASLNVSWAKGATREFVAQQLTAQSASPEAVAAAVVTGPLRGEIPWGKMTALQRLERVDLSGNEVTGAAVSAAAALLPGLKHLNLTFNLIDSLPAAVTAMTALESLHLDMNAISGSLPSGLSALTRLSSLVLGQNRIVGQLPEEIGALSSLVNLDLGENYFHGVPPDSWSNLTNLHLLSLYRLHLTAAFPPPGPPSRPSRPSPSPLLLPRAPSPPFSLNCGASNASTCTPTASTARCPRTSGALPPSPTSTSQTTSSMGLYLCLHLNARRISGTSLTASLLQPPPQHPWPLLMLLLPRANWMLPPVLTSIPTVRGLMLLLLLAPSNPPLPPPPGARPSSLSVCSSPSWCSW
ncbi:hypothetical protein CLOM_g4251 [Closterium sp. NIES-68]|nr:hypothetical protein CLOM_g4251 [Closterium sp. NIES-68]